MPKILIYVCVCFSYRVSAILSLFSAVYVRKWGHFFPNKKLKCTPLFDGRAVCYPSSNIRQDYLAWRQVNCHINNQYNNCFWELVKLGRTKQKARKYLMVTQTIEKYDLLAQQFNIDYSRLPIMFCRGYSVFQEQIDNGLHMWNHHEVTNEGTKGETQNRAVIKHCNIIDRSFWEANTSILAICLFRDPCGT
ncbi:tRNA(His) guanylyltransferase 1-like [Apium graveolens]|uniref:tRNA(His) guanylyltransferase 1-like n=1 Tax=Apium graveolens TaxID=4045 RepID=UPI003D7A96D9